MKSIMMIVVTLNNDGFRLSASVDYSFPCSKRSAQLGTEQLQNELSTFLTMVSGNEGESVTADSRW